MSQTIVVESPFAGDFARNRRFAAWCCRAIWEVEKKVAIASHLIAPQYLDDTVPVERAAGIALDVCWQGGPHYFFEDLGLSQRSAGMRAAWGKCLALKIDAKPLFLQTYHPAAWEAFCRGEWPPCTKGAV